MPTKSAWELVTLENKYINRFLSQKLGYLFDSLLALTDNFGQLTKIVCVFIFIFCVLMAKKGWVFLFEKILQNTCMQCTKAEAGRKASLTK